MTAPERHRSLLLLAACMLSFASVVRCIDSMDGNVKDCSGSETGLSHGDTAAGRYLSYRAMYVNCTHVLKNLEIVFLDGDDSYDLGFLDTIREVNGYVLIVGNHIETLPLRSLRVIRGKSLFHAVVPSYVRNSHKTATPPPPPDDGRSTTKQELAEQELTEQEAPFEASGTWNKSSETVMRSIEESTETSDERKFSIYIAQNNNMNSTIGLLEVQLTSLHEITDGHVMFLDNRMLCYVSAINWTDILGARQARVIIATAPNQPVRPCDNICSENCTDGLCWGAAPDMCQQVKSRLCNSYCKGSCFGPDSTQCCDSECVGGCSGPSRAQCWACRMFNDDGVCAQYCPPLRTYNSITFQWDDNPLAKFAYGHRCIKDCRTVHLLADNGGCVRDCGHGRIAKDGRCISCGGTCPKTCNGTGDGWVDSSNLASFAGCTVVNGSILILDSTFTGDVYHGKEPITLEQLQVFKSVQEITGYLLIDASNDNFTNLSFFKNLRVIHGRDLLPRSIALKIYKTSLQYLGLVSLRSVGRGHIAVIGNPQLCYTKTIDWSIIKSQDKKALIDKNANLTGCEERGEVCSDQCLSKDGCWGPGTDHCRSCVGFRFERHCIARCDLASVLPVLEQCPVNNSITLYINASQTGEHECRRCNVECNNTCTGDGANQCDSCRHFSDGPYCVAECPILKYPDANGTCQPCHDNCNPDKGCTGPGDHLGYGGCHECVDLALDLSSYGNDVAAVCMANKKECDQGFHFFRGQTGVLKADNTIGWENARGCRPCHEECTVCNDASSRCNACKHFRQHDSPRQRGECVAECSPQFYLDPKTGADCRPCDSECVTCFGPTKYDCHRCQHVTVYYDPEDRWPTTADPLSQNQTSYSAGEDLVKPHASDDGLRLGRKSAGNTTNQFYCANICPADFPFHGTHWVDNHTRLESYCSLLLPTPDPVIDGGEAGSRLNIILPCLFIGLLMCGGVAALFITRQKIENEHRKLRLQQSITGVREDDDMELSPTGEKPDMSLLRIIGDSELRTGDVIGSGAFGTVYMGMWLPPGERRVKIPVAIKVLRNETDQNQNKELLDEARIMASVVHPHCLRIFAICMTACPKLITELMTKGCLLDYVRNNRDNIGSKVMLVWAAQIARGMKYLEERQIIHRDLAARNVLLQDINHVRITDFGLATLLKADDEYFLSSGGKMPIKWLALESIQHRKFTHKTDVWSYGVTLWEIFTYGQRPYESVRAVDMATKLEKGERLPQPPICTIDVYMLMIKCWVADDESRPTFGELADEFSHMCRDPGRYLVIQGDELRRQPSNMAESELLLNDLCGDADDIHHDAVLVSAEEYLRPQDMNPQQPYRFDRQLSQMTDFGGDHSPAISISSHPRHLYHPVGSPNSKLRPAVQRMTSLRYSADPCLGDDPELGEAPAGLGGPESPRILGKIPEEMRPATDECDYLRPMSTVRSATTSYLDVVDEDAADKQYINIDATDQRNSSHDILLQYTGNPEYFFPASSDDPIVLPGSCDNPSYCQNLYDSKGDMTKTNNNYNDYHNCMATAPNGKLVQAIRF